MKNKTELLDEGINGSGKGIINTNSSEFKELQNIIIRNSKKQSKAKILENKLISLRFRMESYLLNKDDSFIEVGWFLKEYLRELDIKNKTFAQYIEFKESNLSALFAGRRKINFDLALKLGKIFRTDPTLWIHIQSKNELRKMAVNNMKDYQNYSIQDLIKKAS